MYRNAKQCTLSALGIIHWVKMLVTRYTGKVSPWELIPLVQNSILVLIKSQVLQCTLSPFSSCKLNTKTTDLLLFPKL